MDRSFFNLNSARPIVGNKFWNVAFAQDGLEIKQLWLLENYQKCTIACPFL